jgi:hypothetical protein
MLLILAAVRVIYKHTSLPRAIAIALALSLCSILFASVSTSVFGHSMVFPILGLEWNYVLLFLCLALWIIATTHTLHKHKALSFSTALRIMLALLLLSVPAVNYLYNDIDWDIDWSSVFSVDLTHYSGTPSESSGTAGSSGAAEAQSQAQSQAQSPSEQSENGGESDTGYWVEYSDEDPNEGYVNFKMHYTPSAEGTGSSLEVWVLTGDIYITAPDGRIVACWPYNTPDDFADKHLALAVSSPYFTVLEEEGMAVIQLRLWSGDNLQDCTAHFGNNKITMSEVPLLVQGR